MSSGSNKHFYSDEQVELQLQFSKLLAPEYFLLGSHLFIV